MWPNIPHRASRPNNYAMIDDEERQSSDSATEVTHTVSPWKPPRFMPFKRKALCLFIADLIFFGAILHTISPLISLLQHNQDLFPARFQVTNGHLPKSSTRKDHQIPHILHQTTKDENIPIIWVDSQKSCLKAYANFEYKLWTDDKARAFLEAKYPWFLATWDNYPFPIQRADAIRYFVLYHYGGLYLDMDTVCHEPFPIDQIESDNTTHNCLFEGTLPTGVTNDIMISSAKHPAFERATRLLPISYSLTWWWARLQPYAAIMSSTGPLFISLAVADYLNEQPSLPSPTVQVIPRAGLRPHMSDLQTATWHGRDARLLKWLADKPLVWFVLGMMLVVGGVYALNKILVLAYRIVFRLIQVFVRWITKRAKISCNIKIM